MSLIPLVRELTHILIEAGKNKFSDAALQSILYHGQRHAGSSG